MRTTVNIDDDLLVEAKEWAGRSGRTLGAVIEDALREVLARRGVKDRGPVRLTTFDGGPNGGLAPGIDLDDSASLWDLTDKPLAPG